MAKTILAGALAASILLALALEAAADSGRAGAWAALIAARDAIASDLESGALGEIHAEAESLPELAGALLAQSGDLEAGKRARVAGAVKQMTSVADALHDAADTGDAARVRKDLARLDGLLALIRAQYPAGALDGKTDGGERRAPAPGHGHAEHAHGERPAGVVEAAPQAVRRLQALDALRFEPSHLEVQAGVPTRIELENRGAAEHSLVVKTPDGARDWVHLHVVRGATAAATYRLDQPGNFPVLCTIPGHTEGGMVGELVVTGHRPASSLPR